MREFTFCVPTEVVFGAGSVDTLGTLVRRYGGTRVLLVHGGQSAVRSGLVERALLLLEREGIACAVFGGARPNPLLSHARQGVQQALGYGADFILALGGGSAIDTAKAIALGAADPQKELWDVWTGQHPVERVLPLGAVVTIPAAGSEMGSLAVLTHDGLLAKRVFGAPGLRPCFAVLDPALCGSLPPYQVACSIVDTLLHTLERYFSPVQGNALTDALAEGLLRTVIRFGPDAVKDPTRYGPMSELMWCSSLSNCDLTGVGGIPDFATHELGHELSAQFDVAHGASMSVIWPAWARYCMKTDPGRFAQYARGVWGIEGSEDETVALAGIQATEDLFAALHMPVRFGEVEEIGILDQAGLDRLTQGCLHGGQRSSVGKFRPLFREDIMAIYEAADR